MLTPAIWSVATKGRKTSVSGTIQLLCHVKPGVSANRESIFSVSDERIEICVAAQARDGEANKAVIGVIAAALRVPISDVEVAKGMRSRKKTVVVDMAVDFAPEDEVERIKNMLSRSVRR